MPRCADFRETAEVISKVRPSKRSIFTLELTIMLFMLGRLQIFLEYHPDYLVSSKRCPDDGGLSSSERPNRIHSDIR